ncbi:hypothetical protein [Brevibacillus sp. NRS-1366]|uniref:hypothetical protein n=1 Tax=Brevibacillus sp. NRS-1366 TaxID=3233899 RepID=UPI003D1E0271
MAIHQKTRKIIPFYWTTIGLNEQDKVTFWNQLTFIVCKPGIYTYHDAVSYVENYLGQREIPVRDERPSQQLIDNLYLSMTPSRARASLLTNPIPLSNLLKQIQNHTGIDEKLLWLASTVVMSRGSAVFGRTRLSEAIQACLEYPDTWLTIFLDMFEDKSGAEVRDYLIQKGYHPSIVPGVMKTHAGVTDWELLWGYKLARHGERETILTLMLLPHLHNRLPMFVREKLQKNLKRNEV